MLLQALISIRSGDISSFPVLYDASYDIVYRFLYHRTLDTVLTEDLVSEVYLKAIKSISRLRANSEWEFFSWILRIAYTTLIDATRKYESSDSIDTLVEDIGYERDTARDIDNRSKLEEVLTFMDTLPERDRLILSMRIWDNLSYTEIAEITGETVVNCKKIVSRTLEKIVANVSYIFIFSFLLSYGIKY